MLGVGKLFYLFYFFVDEEVFFFGVVFYVVMVVIYLDKYGNDYEVKIELQNVFCNNYLFVLNFKSLVGVYWLSFGLG